MASGVRVGERFAVRAVVRIRARVGVRATIKGYAIPKLKSSYRSFNFV